MPFSDRAEDLIACCESTLDSWLPADDPAPGQLHRAMRYAVFNGGKRIRPLLCFASGEVLGLERADVAPLAAALELIHCYSLVHDDLPAMDDDDLRRGKPTVHRAFDEATAILAGDGLLTLAFGGLARAGFSGEIIAGVADAAGSRGMVGGQALDLAFESTHPDTAMLETMFRGKTGALIQAAVELPALLKPEVESKTRNALAEYGAAIGLAFQVVDDILDVEGNTAELGKTAGADQARAKATWPAINGLAAAHARADMLLARARAALDAIDGDTEGLAWLGQRIVRRAF